MYIEHLHFCQRQKKIQKRVSWTPVLSIFVPDNAPDSFDCPLSFSFLDHDILPLCIYSIFHFDTFGFVCKIHQHAGLFLCRFLSVHSSSYYRWTYCCRWFLFPYVLANISSIPRSSIILLSCVCDCRYFYNSGISYVYRNVYCLEDLISWDMDE